MANDDHPATTRRELPAWAIGLAGLLSLAVAMGIGRFAFTPMLPLMVQAGQLDLTGAGWIAAANYAGYLAGALTVSRLGWPAPRLAVVALTATAVLTAAMVIPGPTAWWRSCASWLAWRAPGPSSAPASGA